MPHDRLFHLEKRDTVNTFQYNMIMVNVFNISTIYWLSAALIKKKKKAYVKSYNMPITITVNGAE